MGDADDGTTRTKVGRLLERYDLGEEYGAHLEARWLGEAGERASLRTLADAFNRRLLEAALREAGAAVVDGEVENLYRLLSDEDVSAGQRTEAQSRLTREGVDVERLETDFVTYQAIRSYLQNERGAEYEESSAEDRIESTLQATQRLESRVQSVVGSNLDRLRGTEALTLGSFRLLVDVNVLCEDCGTQYGVTDLLRRGGCDCSDGE